MFKNLRNKFILTNMITATIIILIAFSSIFIGFDGSARGGADESWRLDVAMRGMNGSGTHKPGLFFDVEF